MILPQSHKKVLKSNRSFANCAELLSATISHGGIYIYLALRKPGLFSAILC